MTREYSEAVEVENSFRYGQIEHLVRTFGVTQAHLHVEMGPPEDCLMDTVTKYCTDVMVLGASSHGRWHRMVVGSTAATIIESLPCDFLIVRPSNEGTRHSILTVRRLMNVSALLRDFRTGESPSIPMCNVLEPSI